ncbi:MAG: TaqI-like C-terminal specificity domain-containing protein, partial [Nitrosopumilus sp.]
FRALGWEFDQTHLKRHLWDVHREYSQKEKSSTKKPDYAFRVDGKLKFFVEAKAPWIPLTDKKPVFQAKRYAFSTSGKAPIIVLTDFEEFRVFNAMERPVFDNPLQGLLKQFDLHYSNYTENWDLLYDHFSKQAVADGSLDKLRKKLSRNTKPLDEEFLTDITEWREMLARNIAVRNLSLTVDEINEAVQRILDRLIFIRNLEDRQIEDEGLLLKITEKKTNIYSELLPIFHRMGSEYNGLLFNKHFSEELTVDDKIIRTIIKKMCWPQSPFQFDVIEPEILGRIYEKFLGSKIRLTASHHAKVEEKPEVRHAGGVYYTPQYIVDYIVKNTVGKKIEGKSPDEIQNIKIIDPACGSGSFLLGAFDLLMEYHRKWYGKNRNYRKFMNDYFETQDGEIQLTLRKKADILKNNIFGVDIDREATEVAMMSIYLKLLGEGFDKGQALLFLKGNILPDLSDNIKCGNSLIGSDFYDKQNLSLFENDELKRINAFDWKMEFPKVFDSPFEGGKGDFDGFDCVIGNPPYLAFQEGSVEIKRYYKKKYKSAVGKYDQYLLFTEKSLLLMNENGLFGFIIPNKFIHSNYGKGLKEILLKYQIVEILDFYDLQIFKGATNYPCIVQVKKIEKPDTFRYKSVTNVEDNTILSRMIIINQNILSNSTWVLIDKKERDILEKINSNNKCLSDISLTITQGLRTGLLKAYFNAINLETLSKYKIEKELLRSIYHGKNVKRYCSFVSNETDLLLFPYEKDCATPVNISQFPNTRNYLKSYHKELLKRRDSGKVFKNTKKVWFEYWDSKPICFSSPKIVFPDISNRNNFHLDLDGIGYLNTCYGLFLNVDIDYKYILGILNSKLVEYFIKKISPFVRGGFYRYKTKYIEQIPIRTIDFFSQRDKTRHDQTVELVNQMLASHEQLQKIKTDHDRNLIQRKIDLLDRQIDQLVYELYDLTDKEIEIVET